MRSETTTGRTLLLLPPRHRFRRVCLCVCLCLQPTVATVKKANSSSCASCAVAAGAVQAEELRGADSLAAVGATATATAAGNPHRVAFSRGMPSPRHQQQRQSGGRPAAVAGEGEGRGGRAMPFLATGCGMGSYNVVSAVSKAMRTARRGRPKEVRFPAVVGVFAAVGIRNMWIMSFSFVSPSSFNAYPYDIATPPTLPAPPPTRPTPCGGRR